MTVKDTLFLETNENGQIIVKSKRSKNTYLAGKFHTPSLHELRQYFFETEKASSLKKADRVLTVDFVFGDVSELHANPEYRHATFQAASQFNCLEFVGPNVTPEDGITGYVHDKTQGPACSIACGAGTAYRNYFHKWTNRDGDLMVRIAFFRCLGYGRLISKERQEGQNKQHMINNLEDLEKLLTDDSDTKSYFQVKAGYIFANESQLMRLNKASKHATSRIQPRSYSEHLRPSLRISPLLRETSTKTASALASKKTYRRARPA